MIVASASPRGATVRALVQVASAACLWGTWSLLLRPTGLPATLTGPIVLGGVGLLSLPFARRDGVVARWDRATVAMLFAYAALDAVNVLAYFGALSRTTVAIAVLTHYLAPVLVALAAPFVDRQKVPGAMFAAVAATVGLALVLAPWRPENRAGDALLGGALGALSAVAYAANVFISRRFAERVGVFRGLGTHALVAAAMMLPLALFEDFGRMKAWHCLPLGIGILFPGVLAGVLFLRGLPRVGAARAAVLAFLEPLVAVAVGWVFFSEALDVLALAGAVLVLGAGLRVAQRTGAAAS